MSSFVITELAATAIIVTLINIQPKVAFALPDLVFKTNQSNTELEAFEQCDRTFNWNSSDVKALLCRADSRAKLGDIRGALEDYSLALRLDHTNPEIYYKRAILRDRMGDKEGALDDYTQIIKITPNYHKLAPVYTHKYLTLAYTNRGFILSESNKRETKEAAIADFTAAIAAATPLYPDYGEPYRGRASTFSALADLVKSEPGSLVLISSRKEVDRNRVRRLAEWMRYKLQAEADYTSYLSFDPTDSESYDKRGFIRYQIGQVSDDIPHLISNDLRLPIKYDIRHQKEIQKLALADYNQAIRLSPNSAQAYYHRGIVYDDLGYTATALDDYKQVLEIDPNVFLDPNTFITYDERNIPHEQLMNQDAALDDYEKVFNLNVNTFIMNNRPRARGYHERGKILVRLAERLVRLAEKQVIPEESTIAGYYCDASIKQPVQETQDYSQAKKYYDDAIKDFQEAIRYDPNLDSFEYARAFRDRGYIFSRQGDRQKAIRDFNQAIYVNNKYAPAYFARGCVRAEDGDYQGAIEDYTLAIRYGQGKDKERTLAIRQDLNPDFDKAESYYHRGQAYAKLNQHKRAVEDYTEALEKYHLPQAKAAKYHYARADAFYALKEYKKAKQDYTQYLSYNADAPGYREGNQIAEAYRKRANARFELGENQGAIEDYTYYADVTRDTRTAEVYFERGNAFRDAGDRQNAAVDYEQSLYLDGNNLQTYEHRGNYRHGAAAPAKRDRLEIREHNIPTVTKPESPVAYNNRGIARRQSLSETDRQILTQVLTDYNRAISLNPNDPVPYNNRGVVLVNLDQTQAAIVAFNKALSLNPKYAEAYYNRGTVYDELGQQQTAMEDYNQAIALNPQDAEAYYNRGLLRYALTDRQGAIKDIQRAKDLFVKQGNLELHRQAIDLLNKIYPCSRKKAPA
ncbi:tetratricopeptide repeat protein [Pleurocapsales cyanobacterium LEGE 06147]|nr:tetratricopeptide repeat protein [Pleurocapsales cyanobacterium LEGE 06147]